MNEKKGWDLLNGNQNDPIRQRTWMEIKGYNSEKKRKKKKDLNEKNRVKVFLSI